MRAGALEDAGDAAALEKDAIDLSLPAVRPPRGRLHPLTTTLHGIADIFQRMGYSWAEGPFVEDEHHNMTRFLIMAGTPDDAPGDGRKTVTTFVFRVKNVPAALYKAMGGFATNSVNMTKLESYMVEGNFFATQFYADVDGHPDDRNLAFALEELRFFSKELRIVGVYPAHPFRVAFSERAE